MSARVLPTHLDLPELRRDATISAGSIDVVNRTVDIIWTTGARRLTWSWEEWGVIEEELALEGADLSRLNNGAPFLKDHGSWSIDNQLGVHVDGSVVIDLVAQQGRAKIRFSKRAEVEPYWQDVIDGILRQISVGYQVQTYVVTREEGKAPLYRATAWTGLETSLITIGADPGAQVQRAAGAKAPTLFRCQLINQRSTNQKETAMPKNVKTIPNQTKARAIDDATKTKISDILTEAGVAADKLQEYVDKIVALWPADTTAAGTQSADLALAAKALGTEDASPKGIAAAATTLRELYDAKAKELEEAEEEAEEDEFEENEKKGLHRGLEKVRKGFARDTYDSNIGLYRSEVSKVKDITKETSPKANPASRKPIDAHRADTDDAKLAAAAEVEEQRLLALNPKMTRQAAYAQAVKNVKAGKKSA